jgi:ABC-type multidrug transport system fused ATPase/permease subunit
MAARERAVLSGKCQSIADAEAVTAVRRFSADLRAASMEEGEMPPLHCPSADSVEATASELPARVPTILSPGVNRKGPLVMERGRRDKVTREGSLLLDKLQATMAHFDYEEVAVPLTVSLQHMYLTLKTSSVAVLSDICVSIKPFHVTAIMGPSGAGKTSLLCLLRGQAHYANISGALTVNGHCVESLERFRRRTAYVPQEDIVNDELSIDENILYSALLFNRRGYLHAEECMPMVLRAERLLDISHIRTSVVGSAARRGISGGQKKRVSIGMTAWS